MSVRARVYGGGGKGGGADRGGALSVIHVAGASASELDASLDGAGCGGVCVGESRLRRIGGRHEALVARVSGCVAVLTAHDGEASVRGVLSGLRASGVDVDGEMSVGEMYPEAADEVEARALAALARASSPRAVALLLAQSARWRAWDGLAPSVAEIRARSRVLGRLLEAPLVAAVGWTNVGKSTLLNALAGRSVSIVADEPGVTRDHVGATLLLDGVAVRWVDTPGVMDGRGALDAAAWSRACEVISTADVVVICGDTRAGFVGLDALPALRGDVVRVATRADLGEADGAEVRTSAARGEGLEALAREIRTRLVGDADLLWAGPWAFDEERRVLVRETPGCA